MNQMQKNQFTVAAQAVELLLLPLLLDEALLFLATEFHVLYLACAKNPFLKVWAAA